MSVRIALRHRIEERFARPVGLSTHWLRLRPAPAAHERIVAYALHVDAEAHFINWVRDPFENFLARLDLPEPTARLGFDLELVADLDAVNPFDFLVEPYAANHPFEYAAQLRKELTPYRGLPRPGPRFAAWVEALDLEPGYIVTFLTQFNHRIHAALPATAFLPPGPVDVEAVLGRGAASPWEAAWLATLALRTLGLAARFVSGYRVFLGGRPTATLHAWTEVYLPGAGWIGLDPAGGLFTDEGYLPLAAAPDPLRAMPVVGYYEACSEQRVERVEVQVLAAESPRWPFGVAAWNDIQALGRRIDAELRGADLALTVRPGLAFVSATAPDLPEWNSAATGDDKYRVAWALMQRLQEGLGQGGVVQLGQGEAFAGEPGPRWRLGCWSRADGVAVCRDPGRLGGRQRGGIADDALAARLARHLAGALGLAPQSVLAAYEDGLYQRWQDAAAYERVPDAAVLRDPRRRRELAEQLSRGGAELRGYVLPLRWDAAASRWASGSWPMRRYGVYLMPGDASMGYRLPLDGLPLATQRQVEVDRCQFEDRALLPEVHGEVNARLSRVLAGDDPPVAADAEDSPGPRTAVCVEARAGRLYCFLPPLTHLEHYLELVAAVEASAAALDTSVVLEGYAPPEDHRLQRIVVEPDAGVLRVQLPSASDSAALIAMLEVAFAAAEACGLRSERVMVDGTRFAPGVNAPYTLGGSEPARSPFLRRPALLRSLICYWQRHPSLSYLFAGRGIGASGGAPRVDEGRDEALYELALALDRLPGGDDAPPWLADRALRHLLTDPAGNMRRAEIRVDELYDPVRPSRRLGRVTLGAFEMPPSAEYALLLGLLLRGLLARFAARPETGTPRPWGGELHDRFLLPRMLWDDFREVLADLGEVGLAFQPAWFEPLVERRLPPIGEVQFDDIRLSLRQAHEPWVVLAEEVSGGGVARFVDAALDRVQVLGQGLTPRRHVLECNGVRVPLRTTGVVGEFVAGVRFKAANPPATLHPTVAAVGALVFDLIDTWTGRVLGGFTYYPAPPGTWGSVGLPPQADDGLPPGEAPVRSYAPIGLPTLHSRGRFEPRGSGRAHAQAAADGADPERPYLLDVSFPE